MLNHLLLIIYCKIAETTLNAKATNLVLIAVLFFTAKSADALFCLNRDLELKCPSVYVTLQSWYKDNIHKNSNLAFSMKFLVILVS